MRESITDTMIQEHVNKLRDLVYQIQTGKLTILVGSNGTGKSFVRKQLNIRFAKEFGLSRKMVRELSMQLRTESRPEFSALSSALHDSPTAPTSLETYRLFANTMGNIKFTKETPYYLVLDEMEIGMCQESVLGMLEILGQKIPQWLENTLGMMVITHSDLVATTLYNQFDADFIDLGYNELNHEFAKWQTRPRKPMDFKWLETWSNALYEEINRRSRPFRPI